jgi:hypothetical protein
VEDLQKKIREADDDNDDDDDNDEEGGGGGDGQGRDEPVTELELCYTRCKDKLASL